MPNDTLDDYCKHDMVRRDCLDCRPRELRPVPDTVPRAPSTLAHYEGICPACDGDITPGDPIVLNVAGQFWIHTECQ